jgi:hypothetical protein
VGYQEREAEGQEQELQHRSIQSTTLEELKDMETLGLILWWSLEDMARSRLICRSLSRSFPITYFFTGFHHKPSLCVLVLTHLVRWQHVSSSNDSGICKISAFSNFDDPCDKRQIFDSIVLLVKSVLTKDVEKAEVDRLLYRNLICL